MFYLTSDMKCHDFFSIDCNSEGHVTFQLRFFHAGVWHGMLEIDLKGIYMDDSGILSSSPLLNDA